MVARPGGGGRTHVTGGAWDWEPAWAPDGRHIYFRRSLPKADLELEPSEIYAVDLETRSLQRLTENRLVGRLPDPRPQRHTLPDPPKPVTGDIIVPDLVVNCIYLRAELDRLGRARRFHQLYR